jgi:uncharacterized membrane protein (UPF0136 family)
METHQKLSVIGAVLLVITFLINNYHQEVHPDEVLNYAYVTGIAMLVFFSISFIMFTKDRLNS